MAEEVEGPRPPHRSQARGEPLDGATALAGEVALVTGASSGIGRHLVEGLAARGMAVAGLARDGERLAAAMEEVAAATGGRTLAVPADVTDRGPVPRLAPSVRGVRRTGSFDCWSTTPG